MELPPQLQHSPNEDGWDVGATVQYWSTQVENSKLSTVELGLKALTVLVYQYTLVSLIWLDLPEARLSSWLLLCSCYAVSILQY